MKRQCDVGQAFLLGVAGGITVVAVVCVVAAVILETKIRR